MLDEAALRAHLRERGILFGAGAPQVSVLAGGVSNLVHLLEADDGRWVVKQSLARLAVADEWLADRTRLVTEGKALELAATLTPGFVPAVVDIDPDQLVLVITAAPPSWANWKEQLLAGRIDTAVADRLGTILAAWQAGTAGCERRLDDFRSREAFWQLRVDPFYLTVARRLPDVADIVRALGEELMAAPTCLVHGDFSPKNVLAGDDGLWVLDFEVAHAGDPAFDPAFLLTHLLLKSLHRRADAGAYRDAAQVFWSAYQRGATGVAAPAVAVFGHVGAMALARVDGKSPAEYLTPRSREEARRVGRALLHQRPESVSEAWEVLQ